MDVIVGNELFALRKLIDRWLPTHCENFCTGADVSGGIAMAFQTPFHL